MAEKTFTLTEHHIKLVRAFRFRWCDDENGAPCVDPKRPFGNSWIAPDIARIIGWQWPNEDNMSAEVYDEMADVMEGECVEIYHQTETALDIIAARAGMATPAGDYMDYRVGGWALVEAAP